MNFLTVPCLSRRIATAWSGVGKANRQKTLSKYMLASTWGAWPFFLNFSCILPDSLLLIQVSFAAGAAGSRIPGRHAPFPWVPGLYGN